MTPLWRPEVLRKVGAVRNARRAIVVGSVLLTTTLSTTACGGDEVGAGGPDLHQVQADVRAARPSLASQGIYLIDAQIDSRCVTIVLANPTAPNRDFVRRRFGQQVCVSPTGGQPDATCVGAYLKTLPDGPIRVPDVTHLSFSAAQRKVTSSGLRFAIRCLGDTDSSATDHPRDVPASLIRVTRQCPAPGEMVPAGAKVALNGAAALPGGFTYRTATLTFSTTGHRDPCQDGRNP